MRTPKEMAMAMFMLPIAFLLFLILIVLWYVQATRRPKNFPPGPSWLPLVGNVPLLKRMSVQAGGQHKALHQLGAAYRTEVLGLRLGGDLVVCVEGYRLAHHVLTHDEFQGRPDNFFIRLRCMGMRRGITMVDGPLWHEQRSFVVRHLRSIGYGKKTMEDMVLDEMEQILLLLNNTTGDVQFEPIFSPSVLNVLWTLASGSPLSRDDPKLESFLQLLHKRSKAFDMAGGTLSQMPWLRYLIPDRIGYTMIVQLNNELKDFFTGTIKEHHDTWYPDRQDDLIYSFITEMKNNEESNETYTDDQLIMICLDLFLAGALTSSTTLDFIFLEMLLHPDIQEKAAECLNTAISPDEPVTYADRLKVPYVEAIIMESERMTAVAPILGPRRVMRDTTLDGYYIPQNTTVLVNIYPIHYDTEYWGDPNVFRPERFISEDGKLLPSERLLNFSLGRRRCLGELLARQCIFIFFANILRKYRICHVPGTPLPSSIPIPGLICSPQKYKVLLEPRQ